MIVFPEPRLSAVREAFAQPDVRGHEKVPTGVRAALNLTSTALGCSCAPETISTRDTLWEDMSTQNTASHISLWTDLIRRAPDEVRAAPASTPGFSPELT